MLQYQLSSQQRIVCSKCQQRCGYETLTSTLPYNLLNHPVGQLMLFVVQTGFKVNKPFHFSSWGLPTEYFSEATRLISGHWNVDGGDVVVFISNL